MPKLFPTQLPRIVAILVVAVTLAIGFYLWHHAEHSEPPVVKGITSSGNAEAASSQIGLPSPTSSQSTGRAPGIDISTWITLNNKYGWSLKYPASWQANGHESSTPEEDIAPYWEGPGACYEQNQECGYFSIGVWLGSIFPNEKTQALDGLSPKVFLLATQFPAPPDPSRVLLSQGDLTIDGAPAYYIVFRQTNFENYPNGIIMEDIEVKTQGNFYGITYYETGSNKLSIASIGSPNNWQLNPIFEQIVSTIRFSH